MEVTPRSSQGQIGLHLVGFLSGLLAYVISAIISLLSYVLPLQAQLPERVQTPKRRSSASSTITATTTATIATKHHPQPEFKLNSIILSPPDLRTPLTLQRHVSFPNHHVHRSPTLSPTLLPTVLSESESDSESEESIATPPEVAREFTHQAPPPHVLGEFGERLSSPPIYDATSDIAATMSNGSGPSTPLPKSLSTSRIKQRCRRRSDRKVPPTPIPRTQPYEAPFFFPTPDSPAAVGYVERVREERIQTLHRGASFNVMTEPPVSVFHGEPIGIPTPPSSRASSERAGVEAAKVELAIDLLVQSPKRRHSWRIGSGRSPSQDREDKIKSRHRLSWRKTSPPSSMVALAPVTPEKESAPSRSFFRRKKSPSS